MSELDSLFRYNLKTKEVINECNLYPTEVSQDDMYWLWALNNKYDDESRDLLKTGKWMLFLPRDKVNAVWNKIKQAITNGDLWQSKVSTTCMSEPNKTHAIMIYTKDYSDLSDVISVLNYLESSGIKSPQTIIKYKTNQQTRAGIYRGGEFAIYICVLKSQLTYHII